MTTPSPGERERFVDSVGEVLASWNLPRATGRVYGALLLRDAPATFEELRAELGLSAGAVSTGVRDLVSWGLARTIPQPGSRRLRIEAAGGFEQLLAASHVRTRAFIEVLRGGAGLADGPDAAARLGDVTGLFEAYVEAGERMLRERVTKGGGRPAGRVVPRPHRRRSSAAATAPVYRDPQHARRARACMPRRHPRC